MPPSTAALCPKPPTGNDGAMTERTEAPGFAERWRARIEGELADLAAASAATTQDRAPVALDQQSVGRLARMDAMQLQAMATASERRRGDRAGRLRSALARLGRGEFGWCDGCGDEIAEGRLDVDPTVTLCIACARGDS